MNAVVDAHPEITGPSLVWTNSFQSLGPAFFTPLAARALPEVHWVARSDDCAESLGWSADWWQQPAWNALQVASGNSTWPGMAPLASVYSGHQFGVWAGQLGDGRALWLGEIDTPSGPIELQLKGSGPTPYSRMGDGRAVLRSSIREFLCSEAMDALGIPTTRALSVIGSPQPVRRETIETAAVVWRVAPSFIRFGHFEHFSQLDASSNADRPARLKQLADFVIDRFYPACREAANPYAALLEAVAIRTARLMAQWQAVGFCHGVMNTDNMSILGLTIDYGPYGFLDGFDPGHICNHTDTQGRYAWARQPNAAFWNVHALARAMLPLIDDSDLALAAIEPYRSTYTDAMQAALRAKIGLNTSHDADPALVDGLLTLMARDRTDFTIAFRRLASFDSREGADNEPLRDLFIDRAGFDAWASKYADRLRLEQSDDASRGLAMNLVNPKYVLRNHLAETAIRAAAGGDFTEVERLLKVLRRPYDEQPEHAAYAAFPPDWAQKIEVSCSS